jgi:hypothetical protein
VRAAENLAATVCPSLSLLVSGANPAIVPVGAEAEVVEVVVVVVVAVAEAEALGRGLAVEPEDGDGDGPAGGGFLRGRPRGRLTLSGGGGGYLRGRPRPRLPTTAAPPPLPPAPLSPVASVEEEIGAPPTSLTVQIAVAVVEDEGAMEGGRKGEGVESGLPVGTACVSSGFVMMVPLSEATCVSGLEEP